MTQRLLPALLAVFFCMSCSDWKPSRSPVALYRPKYFAGPASRAPAPSRRVLQPRVARFNPDARIISAEFQQITAKRGKWTGMLEGEGHVGLKLLVYQNKRVVASRYVGDVLLRGRPTPFRYESPLPKIGNWQWKLVFTPPV